MTKIFKHESIVGQSAFEVATKLNLPPDFLSEIILEYEPMTYGELIQILEDYHKRDIEQMKQGL